MNHMQQYTVYGQQKWIMEFFSYIQLMLGFSGVLLLCFYKNTYSGFALWMV